MTTKNNFRKTCPLAGDNLDAGSKQYSNLNLNQNHKCSKISAIQSYGKQKNENSNFDSAVSDAYERKVKQQSWNKSSTTKLCSNISNFESFNDETDEGLKKCLKNETKNSTLSLHIWAYENSDETSASDSFGGKNNKGLEKEKSRLIKKRENTKQIFTAASEFVFKNPFEFPRQQNDKVSEPEVSQYKASQRLSNPNETVHNIKQIDQNNQSYDGKYAYHGFFQENKPRPQTPAPTMAPKVPPRKKTVASIRAENMAKRSELNIHFKKRGKEICCGCSEGCASKVIEAKEIEVTNGLSKYPSMNEEYGALERVRKNLSRDKESLTQYIHKVYDIQSILTDNGTKNLDFLFKAPTDFQKEFYRIKPKPEIRRNRQKFESESENMPEVKKKREPFKNLTELYEYLKNK